MSDNLINKELNAVVAVGNFLENQKAVINSGCMMVQQFSYCCERKLNEAGDTYTSVKPVILKFSIRVNSNLHAKSFFKALNANESQSYSFIFNAVFNTSKQLEKYADGMLVDAYVVGVKEDCDSSPIAEDESKQVLLTVTLQVCAVTYVGSDNNLRCTFIK